MILDSGKHFGTELEGRAKRELDVHPHGKNHVVVQQRAEYDGQPSLGQQDVVRVHLDVVHPPAVPGGHRPRQTGDVAQPVRERHERVHVQHG